MAPQPPPVPETEGFFKKLKRKTSNLSGSWNKRWFFVDSKHREFGYAKAKTPGAPKSSIYLNDITAVVQFDDTHFQVESRTRNFFRCGDSKACTTCWVKSLNEYRKKMATYEKEKAKYDAIFAVAASQLTVDAQAAFSSGGVAAAAAAVGQMPAKSAQGGADNRKAENNKGPSAAPNSDEPSRDSFSSSSSMASSSSSSSSSSSPPSNSKRTCRAVEKQPRMERRTPSPTESSTTSAAAREKRSSRDCGASSSHKSERHDDKGDRHRERERGSDRVKDDERDRDRDREREKDRERSREREKDRSRERERERERDRDSRSTRPSNASPSRANSRQFENRSIGDSSSVRAHPGKGYVMQAWVDDDI